jgi:hypothetical protein
MASYLVVRRKGAPLYLKGAQGHVSEADVTATSTLHARPLLEHVPKEPGLYTANVRVISMGRGRPMYVANVGKRRDPVKEIASLEQRTSFKPAHTESPGVQGYHGRMLASQMMQDNRGSENRKMAERLKELVADGTLAAGKSQRAAPRIKKSKVGCAPAAYAHDLADALGQDEAEAFALARWEAAKIPYWVEVYAALVTSNSLLDAPAPRGPAPDWRHRGPYPHKEAPKLWETFGKRGLMCSWCGRHVGGPPMRDDETGKLVDCPLCPAKPWLHDPRQKNPADKAPWQMTFEEFLPWHRAQQTYFEDLPIARQYDLVARRRREMEALDELTYPFDAMFLEAPVVVTGMTTPGPATEDSPGAAPGQMHVTYVATGEEVGTFAWNLTVDGRPLVTPLPPRDPRREKGMFAGGPNIGEQFAHEREVSAALARGDRVPKRVLARYPELVTAGGTRKRSSRR